MIDHVTYTVRWLVPGDWDAFMAVIGFEPFDIPEGEPQYDYETQIKQRWYANGGECDIHIVENREEWDMWGWGHICIQSGEEVFTRARESTCCVRDNDTGRVWLEGPCEIRVEVRP